MNKSVLVINTPKYCALCVLRSGAHHPFCRVNNRDVGIYVPEANDLTCIKKAKRRNRTRPVSEILLMMFRSANRDYRKTVKKLEEMENG